MTWKQRYEQAHREYQAKHYPSSYRDFGPIKTTYPDVRKANGLTLVILNFLKWSGWRATRTNTQGRLIDKVERQESGTMLQVKKWLPTAGRKGSADVSATIKGRSVMLEVKVGYDKPSEYQLREQELERKAGGIYEFVSTPEEFLAVYDKVVT